ncbi:MAG: cobalamin B12-binding domain-containing protein [Alphaproteobacteria bacterium]|nr:cobalamin B12-binding domain-containing protein [Alphaproteobacteria bacterium]
MNTQNVSLKHTVRVVTAASLFDGHDAAINVMRRLIQSMGAEVIHLGHNRSVAEIVEAAIEEDAQAVAVSSYQGGHNEFFRYMVDLLRERGAPHVKVFGGGGGVIVPDEIRALHDYGVDRIYSPEDGRRMGLTGMIADLVTRSDFDVLEVDPQDPADLLARAAEGQPGAVARLITLAEAEVEKPGALPPEIAAALREARSRKVPVIGITGTGGAGKSSLTDELVRRWRNDGHGPVAVLSVDPTRRRTGGALLGDRIRMNAVHGPGCFMRSLATRAVRGELSAAIETAIDACRYAGFQLILVETSGIGQGDSAVMDIADVGVYVMTPEYGAASQLEKIEMLDMADLVIINKFDRRGSQDALRDVRKQVRRNRALWETADDALPVFGTIAAQFNDPGVNAAYLGLLAEVSRVSGRTLTSTLTAPDSPASPVRRRVIPPDRTAYLAEIARTVRDYHRWSAAQVRLARQRHQLLGAAGQVDDDLAEPLRARAAALSERLDPRCRAILDSWADRKAAYAGDAFVYMVRGREIRQPMVHISLSGTKIRRVALPAFEDQGEILRWCLAENAPGSFPYTAGVFPLKRLAELPKRMFAGEGGPAKTNRRFHLLCEGEPAARLSTAFDSVTLYGEDPHERPDIYGKVGESGVSVPTLDDMKILYGGFDLAAPTTSVSMTINGPAPILLAMFLNTAIDQQLDAAEGALSPEREAEIRARTLQVVRGTVQADILKEDQAQNTCIFSTEFALRMMGDIQAYFIAHGVRNYYSVSISGYHIAEAGANPITQLAFTLSNGFTLVEYYLARGMDVDAFAPNLSFFFSNGMDPEYTVLGRVARRIWAITLRDRYDASERSQKLKYHIQTSGRSLHAREIQFNDIRTTLQALLAYYDNCNSLHTNAYDEAITTPTEESVRRAMAIQLILVKEFGLLQNENALQGSFIVEQLTDLVEEAVLVEFERLNDRGGVLGAMERQYQRGKIQDESLHYERLKHSGELPLVGINTFEDPATLGEDWEPPAVELRRATVDEKREQIERVGAFQARHAEVAPEALARLKQVALDGGNIFAELMNTVRVASLGQITHALYEVGGEYRRNL